MYLEKLLINPDHPADNITVVGPLVMPFVAPHLPPPKNKLQLSLEPEVSTLALAAPLLHLLPLSPPCPFSLATEEIDS